MKVSEFLMPYVLSRLIYNVSGKGGKRVRAREEAQRHELGAYPPPPWPDGETEAKRRSHMAPMPGPQGLPHPQEGRQGLGPSRPPWVVWMDPFFSF